MRAFVVRAVLAAAMLSSVAVHAQSADTVARARTHFEAGRALYNLGNYTDAIREFSAGYQLAPRPQFLLNLGQAYRKLNDLQRARDMYKKYLDEAPPNDPDREQVRQIAQDLEQQIASQPAPVPVPPLVHHEAQPAPVAAAVVVEPPPKKSFIKKHWWIIPVSAVVLAGVGVGIYFGVRPAPQVDCSAATLGCIDAMGR
jgi:tetratricopeptide (TPR) repeat protein